MCATICESGWWGSQKWPVQTSSSTRGRYGKSPLQKREHTGWELIYFCSFSSAWIFRRTGKEQRTYFYVEENVRLSLFIENSPGERVRKLKAMFARGTMVSMQLSPLVSIKSWRVMAVGSMWCSRNGRIKACKTDQKPCSVLFRVQPKDYNSENKKNSRS